MLTKALKTCTTMGVVCNKECFFARNICEYE